MRLDFVRPFIKYIPEIAPPQRPTSLKEKLMWSTSALIIFFIMYHVFPIGVDTAALQTGGNDFLQVVTASRIGSLITSGIGPIILASIFLQLFTGAKIIEVDTSDPDQKALFHGTQKLLAIALSFFEAAVFVSVGGIPIYGAAGGIPLFGSVMITTLFVILQLALGSIILLYLDEIVSKYGIGSGISLFIAAGVSLSIVQGTVYLLFNPDVGAIGKLQSGSADAIPQALMALLPLAFTAIVFLVVTFAEGMKVEIPLSFERARGFMGRFPIKLLYVSNIPVILASALLLNIQLWARIFEGKSLVIGGTDVLPYIINVQATPFGARIVDGLIYLITPLSFSPLSAGGYTAYLELLSTTTPILGISQWVHAFFYIISLTILCVIFGRFWIETTGMGPKEVAEQLNRSGMQVPGFRRDPRVVERVLEKYIPTITILGSIFVGLLAGFADLTGALGTGTGILLTVGILHRLYEDLSAQHMFDIYPDLRNFIE
ncbi:preprotein translocase subunit SecY [Candidatus Micrarchaeota archaeon]|nr:MAG: preprotein translocase subunit SecY [Candidatus Micrarchaeota archaeon]